MELVKQLLTYLLIYSFLGWVIESVYKSICQRKLINSGFLYGPICPIYGFGAIIMYLFLDSIRNNPILVFIIGFIVLTIWEYIVGVFLEKVFHTKYWDYSKNKFNFQGRICLLNSLFWGILAVAFIYIIHPFVEQILSKIPDNITLYVVIVGYVILIIDTVISVINSLSIVEKLKHIEELNKTIKEKLDEIKAKGMANIPVQETIDELKLKQEKLAKKMYKSILRMKRAFPTMKSEQINEETYDTRSLHH